MDSVPAFFLCSSVVDCTKCLRNRHALFPENNCAIIMWNSKSLFSIGKNLRSLDIAITAPIY